MDTTCGVWCVHLWEKKRDSRRRGTRPLDIGDAIKKTGWTRVCMRLRRSYLLASVDDPGSHSGSGPTRHLGCRPVQPGPQLDCRPGGSQPGPQLGCRPGQSPAFKKSVMSTGTEATCLKFQGHTCAHLQQHAPGERAAPGRHTAAALQNCRSVSWTVGPL